ncbi:hypothetical protein [Rhizohabitans arisaemae]|uniref:hypothetical protein n=1 Tax=Rhizohabitans arisaemae TaxID=2720610 RepID=UPI0024B1FE6C|nr:hypothetical protein [Rhizohabitans arisaemae]
MLWIGLSVALGAAGLGLMGFFAARVLAAGRDLAREVELAGSRLGPAGVTLQERIHVLRRRQETDGGLGSVRSTLR